MEMVVLGFVLLVGLASSLVAMSNTTWPSEEERYFSDLRKHPTKSMSADQRSEPPKAAESGKSSQEKLKSALADRLTASLAAKVKYPQKVADDATERERVRGIMGFAPHYCYEFQSLSVARIMMRENHLRSLPVVDFGKRWNDNNARYRRV